MITINSWLKRIQSWLPSTCLLCGESQAVDDVLCQPCAEELPGNAPACTRCGAHLPVITSLPVCGRCLRRPPTLDRTVAAFRYAPPLDHLIQRFKFDRKLALGPLFAEAMVRAVQDQGARPECLIPVPLHPARLRQRGYNQAVELARPLGEALNIPVELDAVSRVRATLTQSELPADQRRGNVKDAFNALRPFPYQHVAIIDDVMTTGSTLHEMARTLRRAGVETVEAWVCARA